MKTKKELLERGVSSDPKLSTMEKETSMTFPNDMDVGLFHSEVPTTVKWFLSVDGTVVEDYRLDAEGQIVSVTGRIPKSIVKLQSKNRKSSSHSQMVSYGSNLP